MLKLTNHWKSDKSNKSARIALRGAMMDVSVSKLTKPVCCENSFSSILILVLLPSISLFRVICRHFHLSTFLTFFGKEKKHMESSYKQFFPTSQSLSIVLQPAFKSTIPSSSFWLLLTSHTVCTTTRSSNFLVHKIICRYTLRWPCLMFSTV